MQYIGEFADDKFEGSGELQLFMTPQGQIWKYQGTFSDNKLSSSEEATLELEDGGNVRIFSGVINDFVPSSGRLMFKDMKMQFDGNVSKDLYPLDGTLTQVDSFTASGTFNKLELCQGKI